MEDRLEPPINVGAAHTFSSRLRLYAAFAIPAETGDQLTREQLIETLVKCLRYNAYAPVGPYRDTYELAAALEVDAASLFWVLANGYYPAKPLDG